MKSKSHHDVAHLHPLSNVPTKYQPPTLYSFRDIARTRFFPPPAHPDTMGENNTPAAVKGYGVKTAEVGVLDCKQNVSFTVFCKVVYFTKRIDHFYYKLPELFVQPHVFLIPLH